MRYGRSRKGVADGFYEDGRLVDERPEITDGLLSEYDASRAPLRFADPDAFDVADARGEEIEIIADARYHGLMCDGRTALGMDDAILRPYGSILPSVGEKYSIDCYTYDWREMGLGFRADHRDIYKNRTVITTVCCYELGRMSDHDYGTIFNLRWGAEDGEWLYTGFFTPAGELSFSAKPDKSYPENRSIEIPMPDPRRVAIHICEMDFGTGTMTVWDTSGQIAHRDDFWDVGQTGDDDLLGYWIGGRRWTDQQFEGWLHYVAHFDKTLTGDERNQKFDEMEKKFGEAGTSHVFWGYDVVHLTGDGAGFQGAHVLDADSIIFGDSASTDETGGAVITEDYGRTWEQYPLPNESAGTRDIVIRGDAGVAARHNSRVSITSDGGNSWSNYLISDIGWGDNEVRGAHPVNAEVFYVVGGGGSGIIAMTKDGGDTWTSLYSTGQWMMDITAVGANLIWACGQSGTLVHSSDGGDTWVGQSPATSDWISSIDFLIDGQTGYFIDGSGRCFRTTNSGDDWSPVLDASTTFRRVATTGADGVFVCGDDGHIWTSTDGGDSWDRQTPRSSSDFRGGGIADDGTVWAGGSDQIVEVSPEQIEISDFDADISGADRVREITDDGQNYRLYEFFGDGEFELKSDVTVEYLLVGGGGSGGSDNSGGGGGGDVLTGAATPGIGTYSVAVGRGGEASMSGGVKEGENGEPTSVFSATAIGGGGGGSDRDDGLDGGSGGGGAGYRSDDDPTVGGSATGQGNGHDGGDGGQGQSTDSGAGGGGGGAAGPGQDASGNDGGDGGDGVELTFTGDAIRYGAGGGGGLNEAGGGTTGDGGAGGGGDGSGDEGHDGAMYRGAGGGGAGDSKAGGRGGYGYAALRVEI